MDCSSPSSSICGIFEARILEWAAVSFSRGSSQPRDWTHVSSTGRQILYSWTTGKAPYILLTWILKPNWKVICEHGGQHSWLKAENNTPGWLRNGIWLSVSLIGLSHRNDILGESLGMLRADLTSSWDVAATSSQTYLVSLLLYQPECLSQCNW